MHAPKSKQIYSRGRIQRFLVRCQPGRLNSSASEVAPERTAAGRAAGVYVQEQTPQGGTRPRPLWQSAH
eukprot:2451739-Pyramimonas_sp.AAC.1